MKKLNEIQQKLKVPKAHRNTFANYDYRNAEDILEAVKPLLGDDGVLIVSDEVIQIGGRFYVKATAELFEGDKLEATASAFAREPEEKKGSDASQITGAASSYARKYALCGLFAIDDGEDADKQDNSTHKPSAEEVLKATLKAPLKFNGTAPDLERPKVAAQSKEGKKKAIADLLISRVSEDQTNFSGEPKTKEDFEEACLRYTELPLTDDNLDAILKSLIK